VAQGNHNGAKPLELVWIDCPYPVVTDDLVQTLEAEARVHIERDPPDEDPSVVIFGVGGIEGLLEVSSVYASKARAP
jgi:hypothetical protein